MRASKTFVLIVTALITISFTTANASITTTKANTTQSTSNIDGLDIIIDGKTIHVETPINSALVPIIVKVTNAAGKEIHNEVVADGIDHLRVVADGIDHLRVVADGIDHLRIEVFQDGKVIFTKEI